MVDFKFETDSFKLYIDDVEFSMKEGKYAGGNNPDFYFTLSIDSESIQIESMKYLYLTWKLSKDIVVTIEFNGRICKDWFEGQFEGYNEGIGLSWDKNGWHISAVEDKCLY